MICQLEHSTAEIGEFQLKLFESSDQPNLIPNQTLRDIQPFRPLQYLGAKSRAIPYIIRQVSEQEVGNNYVLDAFSGSSVVSQSLAQSNYNVIANDSLGFCAGLAKTFLNINRSSHTESDLTDALTFIKSHSTSSQYLWNDLIDKEQSLLKKADTFKLSAFYKGVPTVWRTGFINDPIKQFFHSLRPNTLADKEGGLASAYYAGTYFGVEQAVEIDSIRHAILYLKQTGLITDWQHSALLTSLVNTMSKAVHSAGKHFAQAIKIDSPNRAAILHKRLLEDRRINIGAVFQQSVSDVLQALSCKVFNVEKCHYAYNESIEHLGLKTLPSVKVIYADPPYTAQQYSRFYHIPEVIFDYKYPSLQEVNGQVTTGLYPKDKVKSSFCAKSTASVSFERLFQLSKDLQSHLLISYSFSVSGNTGNNRMISLDKLLELGRYYFGEGSVTIDQLEFNYRQLNSKVNAVAGRQDKEFLLLFRNS